MAVGEKASADALARIGLPREEIMAWLGCGGGAASGDYKRDVEDFSRQWRLCAAMLARLPAKASRSAAEIQAAAAIVERDRAARQDFLAVHAEAVYRRLTDDFAKFKRVELLVRDAAAA